MIPRIEYYGPNFWDMCYRLTLPTCQSCINLKANFKPISIECIWVGLIILKGFRGVHTPYILANDAYCIFPLYFNKIYKSSISAKCIHLSSYFRKIYVFLRNFHFPSSPSLTMMHLYIDVASCSLPAALIWTWSTACELWILLYLVE